MKYPPGLLDEIRARLPVSSVVSRKVQLKKAGREWKGLSPFKQEKTPSFTVNDQKGFYHCFATGEHGDIFKFLMVTEGLQFPEAVSRLAEEAGVELPKPTARDERQEEERDRLQALMEASARWFEQQLFSGAGREAEAYLQRRGVTDEARRQFRIGFEPNDRQALRTHLATAGFADREMIRSGMLIGGEDIRTPYSRFRGRILFPITDLGGRVVAFGGRALDPSVPAKYLNSPETPLFHKGSILFNAAVARPHAHKSGRIIVCEGYMDVVALWQAGFPSAVAPLGTAVTERQLDLLWRFAEPVFCLDGDAAGRKAATRALETALPHLTADRQITFAFLPDGLDPDDLIKAQGPDAMDRILAGSFRVFDYLFRVACSECPGETVEDLARLEATAGRMIARVPDDNLRRHYSQALRNAVFERSKAQRRGNATGRGLAAPAGADWRQRVRHGEHGPGRPGGVRKTGSRSASIARSALVTTSSGAGQERERLILLALLNHPSLIEDDVEEIAGLAFDSATHGELRDTILNAVAEGSGVDSATLIDHVRLLEFAAESNFLNHVMARGTPRSLAAEAPRHEVLATWKDLLRLQQECRAERERQDLASEGTTVATDDADYERLLDELGSHEPEYNETIV